MSELEVDEPDIVVVVQKVDTGVAIAAPGPQGARGPAGPPGGAGFTHDQVAPSATWLVQHNLNRYPTVSVIDTDGNLVLTDAFYSDVNTIVLTFAAPTTGKAVCS